MTVKRICDGFIYLYPEIPAIFENTGAVEAFLVNKDRLVIIEEGDARYIKIPYSNDGMLTERSVINPHRFHNKHYNAKIIQVYEGKEYEEYEQLPVPTFILIYQNY